MSQKKKNGLCFVMAGLMLGSVVTGCKTKVEDYSSTVVATYGEEKIYMDEAYFYAKLTQYQYESYYGNSLWSYDFSGNGKTFEDTVRENVMSQIYQTYILNDEAEKMGITLDAEQIAIVEENVAEFMQNEKMIEATKATEAMVDKVYTMNAIANLVYESLVEDTDKEVNEEEFLCKKISYVTLTTSSEDISDEDLEVYAEEILAEMEEGTALEDIEDTYETDDYSIAVSEDVTLMEDDNRLYQETAWAMKEGEYAMTFSEESGYWYMIHCVDEDDEEAREQAIKNEIASREEQNFEEKYAKILETAKAFDVNESKWNEIKYIDNPVYIAESTEDTTEEGTTESVEESSEEISEETSTEEISTEETSTEEISTEEASSEAE